MDASKEDIKRLERAISDLSQQIFALDHKFDTHLNHYSAHVAHAKAEARRMENLEKEIWGNGQQGLKAQVDQDRHRLTTLDTKAEAAADRMRFVVYPALVGLGLLFAVTLVTVIVGGAP